MIVDLARIECTNIRDWDSFHKEFNMVFGFPDFYGENLNAWIDCMSSLDSPEHGMTSIHCAKGKVLTLWLKDVEHLMDKHSEIYQELLEIVAFVNYRRIEIGKQSVLTLAYFPQRPAEEDE